MVNDFALVQHLHLTHHLVKLAVAHLRHQFANLFRKIEEEVDHVLRLADKALAQNRVLRGNAHRTGVEMTLAHHNAACSHQRRGGAAKFVSAQKCADHHIASGAQTAIHLHGYARAQVVHHQCLMRFRQAHFPRAAGVLDRSEW